jgi:hypothetical protein
MDNLPSTATTLRAHSYLKAPTPLQHVHVYRHVDSANLESSPNIWPELNESLVVIDIDCPPHTGDCRGELSDSEEQEFFGGAL